MHGPEWIWKYDNPLTATLLRFKTQFESESRQNVHKRPGQSNNPPSVSFFPERQAAIFAVGMHNMGGIEALQLAREVSKVPDGTFTIAFFPYNRIKGEASARLRVLSGCKVRAQLPRDKFWIDSENYFLFTDEKGACKTCYRILIRFMGFPQDNFKLRKIEWL